MALKTLTGIWRKEAKSGTKYLSAFMKGDSAKQFLDALTAEFKRSKQISLQIFNNQKREGKDNDPDFTMSLATFEEKPATKAKSDDAADCII